MVPADVWPTIDRPKDPESILERAARCVDNMPADRVCARWFDNKGDVEDVRTFKGVWRASGEVSYQLRVKWGLRKGDRVILAFNFGLRFFPVFLGCLRAGVVAVPVYPPSPATLNKSLASLQLIVDNCQPKLILVCPAVNKLRQVSKINVMSSASKLWPDVPYKCPDVREEGGGGSSLFAMAERLAGNTATAQFGNSFDEPSTQPDDIAFLQYTSGSTSDPKGVMITFGNLQHNVEAIISLAEEEARVRGGLQGEDMTWFSWLPTFHDMGLIQGTLAPFVAGWRAGYMSPVTFIRRPLLWLQLMSRERTTFTSAPNFALSLCVRKWREANPEARAALQLDLTACLGIQNSAEPVRVATVRDFGSAFSEVGLRPCYAIVGYGLAEHVVCVGAFSPNPRGAPLDSISDTLLQVCISTAVTSMLGIEVKVVDPGSRRELPTGVTGELWLKSPSVAAGYWGQPELSTETFRAELASSLDGSGSRCTFLRTGDLCRIDSNGHIFVEGRLKDLIIVNGRNLYPQDIECAAQDSTAAVRPGCVAAFSTTELGGDLEVVLEIRKAFENNPGAVLEALESVGRAVGRQSGLQPKRVVAIKEKSIPKTTSGKIQRRLTRTMLHGEQLAVISEIVSDTVVLCRSQSQETNNSMEVVEDEHTGETKYRGPRGSDRLVGFHDHVDAEELVRLKDQASPASESQEPELHHAVQAQDPEDTHNVPLGAGNKPKGYNLPLDAGDVARIVEKATGMRHIGHFDDLLDLGVDSSSAVGISSDLSEACGHDLPAELVFGHPTASNIADYVASLGQAKGKLLTRGRAEHLTQGAPVEVASVSSESDVSDAADYSRGNPSILQDVPWTMGPMRGWCFRVVQAMLLVLVIAQIFGCMLPARAFYLGVRDLRGADHGVWTTIGLNILLVFTAVVWFIACTVLAIAVKWIVLGKSFQGRVPLSSPTYLGWWYANATLKVWEKAGGWWLLDSRLIVLVYRLMGAQIAWNAKIVVFISDCDMVEIGAGASIEGHLLARRFNPSSMILQRLKIGKWASIGAGAVVYGATQIGDHSVVRPQCVIPPRSNLQENSTWEGHPVKAVSRSPDEAMSSTTNGSCPGGELLLEVAKMVAIVATLQCVAGFASLCGLVFDSIGVPRSFRYRVLVKLAIVIGGTIALIAVCTVGMKWILAGTVKEGEYMDTCLRRLRRWYLFKLQIAVSAYFLMFNRMRLYDWWSAAVGMRVGDGSWVLTDTALCNLEDAHLVEVGSGSVVSYANLAVDRPIGTGGKRVKRGIVIGSRSLVGYRAHLGAGASMGDGSMMAGFAIVRSGESLPEGTATMSDNSSIFKMTTARTKSSGTPTTGGNSWNRSGVGLLGGAKGKEGINAVLVDVISSVGSWLLNGLAMVGAYEVRQALLRVPFMRDNAIESFLVVGTAVVIAWMLLVAVLVVIYKWVVIGNLSHMSKAKEAPIGGSQKGGGNAPYSGETAATSPAGMEEARGRQRQPHRDVARYTAAELMRWRKFDSVLRSSLFEPYICPLLQGTWFLNLWLKAMGGHVSMGALVLGLVKDYDMVEVCDGAVVTGFVVGHRYTLLNEEIVLELTPTTVGPCAVVEAYSVLRGGNMQAAATIVAGSVSVKGQVLKAGGVYGGRPPKKLGGECWEL